MTTKNTATYLMIFTATMMLSLTIFLSDADSKRAVAQQNGQAFDTSQIESLHTYGETI